MSKHSQTLVRLRYLCDAPLRSEVVVPLLADELRRLVGFGAWAFVWTNADGQLVNSAHSPLRPETLRYFAEHFDNLGRDCGFSVHEAVRSFPAVSNPWRTGRVNPHIEDTESYEKVWGPEGCHHSIILAVRTADDMPLGLLQIFRPRDDVDFEPGDEAELGRVLPYLRRLLLRESARAGGLPMVQDGLAGVALFVDEGPATFVSDRAFTLSTLAFNDRLPVTPNGMVVVDPLDSLRAMRREVADMTPQQSGGGEPTTVLRTMSNSRGDFTFEWESSPHKGDFVWSVVVRHQIPARLRLLSLPRGAELSDRQLEVCLGLLDGNSLIDIALRMGVKAATMKDHTRQVYRKLEVKDRDGLLRKVMSLRAP